jgi:transglutaminase superfamily protein
VTDSTTSVTIAEASARPSTRSRAATTSAPDGAVPSLLPTIAFIGVLKLALRLAGFQRTWRWIERVSSRAPLALSVSAEHVRRAEYAVARAAALYPGRALCLERSLTLYFYLRRRGVPVRYLMGSQMYPFGAHAWVEFDGMVINDVPEHVKRFRPFVRHKS